MPNAAASGGCAAGAGNAVLVVGYHTCSIPGSILVPDPVPDRGHGFAWAPQGTHTWHGYGTGYGTGMERGMEQVWNLANLAFWILIEAVSIANLAFWILIEAL